MNHCLPILCYIEIYQISSYKTEAQCFIFIPTKEAPALVGRGVLSLVGSTLAARHFNSNGAKLSNIYEISKFFEGKKRKYPLYRVNRHTFFCFKFLQFSLHLPRKFCIFA